MHLALVWPKVVVVDILASYPPPSNIFLCECIFVYPRFGSIRVCVCVCVCMCVCMCGMRACVCVRVCVRSTGNQPSVMAGLLSTGQL